jgi:hypothetical protein
MAFFLVLTLTPPCIIYIYACGLCKIQKCVLRGPLDLCTICGNGLGFGVWGSYLFMQVPILFVFCAIALQAITFSSSDISRWAKCLCTSFWLWFFHVSLFLWWCSHVCSDCIVHTFPPFVISCVQVFGLAKLTRQSSKELKVNTFFKWTRPSALT